MSDEQQKPWERIENEPQIWYRRFERFLLMFPKRSIAAVFQEEETERNREKPRIKPTGDWYEMAEKWQWEERTQAWDDAQFAEDEKVAARVRRSGFALQYKRILALQDLVDGLITETKNQERVWLPDVKAIGNGPDAERVDLVQFNDALFKEIREYITDIADEMGDRVKKKEIAVTSLPPDLYEGIGPNDDGSEP
jgi:hypothetical protein